MKNFLLIFLIVSHFKSFASSVSEVESIYNSLGEASQVSSHKFENDKSQKISQDSKNLQNIQRLENNVFTKEKATAKTLLDKAKASTNTKEKQSYLNQANDALSRAKTAKDKSESANKQNQSYISADKNHTKAQNRAATAGKSAEKQAGKQKTLGYLAAAGSVAAGSMFYSLCTPKTPGYCVMGAASMGQGVASVVGAGSARRTQGALNNNSFKSSALSEFKKEFQNMNCPAKISNCKAFLKKALDDFSFIQNKHGEYLVKNPKTGKYESFSKIKKQMEKVSKKNLATATKRGSQFAKAFLKENPSAFTDKSSSTSKSKENNDFMGFNESAGSSELSDKNAPSVTKYVRRKKGRSKSSLIDLDKFDLSGLNKKNKSKLTSLNTSSVQKIGKDLIGKSNDNLFEMIHKRYQKKRTESFFVDVNAKPTPRLPAQKSKKEALSDYF